MQKTMNKPLKIVLKTLLIVFLVILVILGGYVAYLFSAFYRIDDNLALSPKSASTNALAQTNKQYSLISWNIGFASYSDDYSFFMDGGKESRGFSKEEVQNNLNGIINTLNKHELTLPYNSFDFACFQEVDFDSTRTYKLDLREAFYKKYTDFSSTYAQNYDSPYLMYPIFKPHGANKSGMLTFSKLPIKSALRVQLPIESGINKFFDLDRCYSKNRIQMANGKELVLIHMHLSAYTTDGTIATKQLELILADCKAEYDKGNYVVCAGDFNKDLIDEGSENVFGVPKDTSANWAQQIDPAMFEGTNMKKVVPVGKNGAVPSCRNADKPYSENNFVLTVDGFLVSDNVTVNASYVLDEQFKYSDHNPVVLYFKLNA